MLRFPAVILILLALFSYGAESSPTTKPIIIAHRGASGYLPEHTLEAKAVAHAMGADFIEQDIVITKDDVPIVLHDIMLESTTDVAKRFPDRKRADGHFCALDFTLAEVKQLRANERINPKTGESVFPKRFPVNSASFQIPTLEEELQLIQGLNKSTGREAGIYPEIKQPSWHRKQGHDISAIVLPILQRYGYATKRDACWIQCFDVEETKRIRADLGWQGRLVLLLDAKKANADSAAADKWFTPDGLAEIARFADGIGPALSSVVSGKSKATRKPTDLVRHAHAANLVVHPYTLRADDLPPFADSLRDATAALFNEAHADGVFTDFPDQVISAGFVAANNRSKPNIVVIYGDDIGVGDFSCYGSKAVSTPNVDRLAARGLRFASAYSTAATCTPSRYSLLTGEYAFRKPGTGILAGDAKLIIRPGRETLPGMLQRAGYRPGVVGKWHLGLGEGSQPLDWNADIRPGPLEVGFDHAFIMAATGDRVPCVFY